MIWKKGTTLLENKRRRFLINLAILMKGMWWRKGDQKSKYRKKLIKKEQVWRNVVLPFKKIGLKTNWKIYKNNLKFVKYKRKNVNKNLICR